MRDSCAHPPGPHLSRTHSRRQDRAQLPLPRAACQVRKQCPHLSGEGGRVRALGRQCPGRGRALDSAQMEEASSLFCVQRGQMAPGTVSLLVSVSPSVHNLGSQLCPGPAPSLALLFPHLSLTFSREGLSSMALPVASVASHCPRDKAGTPMQLAQTVSSVLGRAWLCSPHRPSPLSWA